MTSVHTMRELLRMKVKKKKKKNKGDDPGRKCGDVILGASRQLEFFATSNQQPLHINIASFCQLV